MRVHRSHGTGRKQAVYLGETSLDFEMVIFALHGLETYVSRTLEELCMKPQELSHIASYCYDDRSGIPPALGNDLGVEYGFVESPFSGILL